MAMTKCAECGAEISTQAAACPKCGAVRGSAISGARILWGLVIGCALLWALSKFAPG